ncbi:hypothetical protein B0H12DRAFT_1094572 [Mycena haematopus]|nr:hypothetical protein B0H12DRAFT_1094572 [Mycena haematopus]
MKAMQRRGRSLSSVTHVSDSEGSYAGSDAFFRQSPEPNTSRGRTLRRCANFSRYRTTVLIIAPIRSLPPPKRSASHVSDSEGSYVHSDASPSPKAERTYDTSQMPVELWVMVAGFASRSSVACLCSVSHHFCSLFTSILYGNTVEPSLTASQTYLLLQTLSIEKPACSKPHPALLVRDLGLVDDGTILNSPAAMNKALKRLHFAEGLRALHWTLASGVDELGKIFGAPGRFPHLKELAVSCKGTNNNFHFVQIAGLEVFGLDLNLECLMDNYDDLPAKLIYKLSESLGMLPSSSPLLHTLQLNLKIPFYEDTFPDDAYTDLIATVNGLHLPVLATLDLSVDLIPPELYEYSIDFEPETDFSPFLAAHPNLLLLTLHVHGTKLTEEDEFLPRLRCFQGSFQDAAVICAHPRQLQSLVLALIHLDFMELMPSFKTIPLASHSSLTHVRVFAADTEGKTLKISDQLSPTSFRQLVSSFPNVTHLDVVISQRMTMYHDDLILLTKLQSLRIKEYRTRVFGPPIWPARLVFPPDEYIREFAILLPSLSKLARIEICLLGDIYSDPYEIDYEEMWLDPPELTIEYCFSVLRPPSGAYVVLDNARIDDRYSRISS